MKWPVSPYINHFISADTIIPNQANPQGWNRYSYVQNNPINLSDPSGHKACSNILADGKCDKSQQKVEDLLNYTDSKVLNKNGKNKTSALKSMEMVVRKAASLFGQDWNGFLDATTFIFTGYYGHGAGTMLNARHSGNVGLINGDTGFHSDFRDFVSQQVRHFWAGFATAANPTGDNPAGPLMANIGNDYHEITQDTRGVNDGASVQDYALTLTAIDIASQTGNSIKNPSDLAQVLIDRLGADGPGYTGTPIPRDWWWTPDN